MSANEADRGRATESLLFLSSCGVLCALCVSRFIRRLAILLLSRSFSTLSRRLGGFLFARVVHELDHIQFLAIASPATHANNSGIAAGTILETSAQLVKKTLHGPNP